MEVTEISEATKPAVFAHSNIVVGVVATRTQLDAITAAVKRLDVNQVETLEGITGLSYLEKKESSFKGLMDFFMGDMETAITEQRASIGRG